LNRTQAMPRTTASSYGHCIGIDRWETNAWSDKLCCIRETPCCLYSRV